MKSVLVLLCHPALEKSRINLAWSRAARRVSGVTLVDLYEIYPDFDVDARHEQELLAGHDLLVLQHPFHWYSTPALLKQWFDIVLEHGWAYGKGGDALAGKALVHALSAGGQSQAYTPEGFHGITMRELLAPVRQTARLCGMRYLKPFVQYGAFSMTTSDIEASAERYERMLFDLSAGVERAAEDESQAGEGS